MWLPSVDDWGFAGGKCDALLPLTRHAEQRDLTSRVADVHVVINAF